MTMANNSKSPAGFREVLAFLEEGRHRLPSGGFITLNTFRKHFKGHDFVAVHVLDAYFPNTSQALRGASVARRAASVPRSP